MQVPKQNYMPEIADEFPKCNVIYLVLANVIFLGMIFAGISILAINSGLDFDEEATQVAKDLCNTWRSMGYAMLGAGATGFGLLIGYKSDELLNQERKIKAFEKHAKKDWEKIGDEKYRHHDNWLNRRTGYMEHSTFEDRHGDYGSADLQYWGLFTCGIICFIIAAIISINFENIQSMNMTFATFFVGGAGFLCMCGSMYIVSKRLTVAKGAVNKMIKTECKTGEAKTDRRWKNALQNGNSYAFFENYYEKTSGNKVARPEISDKGYIIPLESRRDADAADSRELRSDSGPEESVSRGKEVRDLSKAVDVDAEAPKFLELIPALTPGHRRLTSKHPLSSLLKKISA